jgi:hypothetical protein
LREGDLLVITRLSPRCAPCGTCSPSLGSCAGVASALVVLKQNIDTTTLTGHLVFHRLCAIPSARDDDGRAQVNGIAMPGALATLDAMLWSSQGGFPPATVASYRDQGTRALAEVLHCVWSPADGPPARPPATPCPGPGTAPARNRPFLPRRRNCRRGPRRRGWRDGAPVIVRVSLLRR